MKYLLLILFGYGGDSLLAQNKSAVVCGLVKPEMPGAIISKDSSIRIKFYCGSKVLSSNSPLYYVDGREVDQESIRSLNPNEIQSVKILKSQRSCWGKQLKDVVIITTKCNTSNTPAL